MPGKSGYEVAEYVKKTPKLAHIPVVLLTGAFEPVDQAKANAVGCDGVLAKPFEPQIVIGRVRELLGRSASAAGGAPASAIQGAAASPMDAFAVAPAAPAEPQAEVVIEHTSQTKVEDYFDRLDAAFANLTTSSGASAARQQSPPAEPA